MKCAAVIIRRCCTRCVRGLTQSRKNVGPLGFTSVSCSSDGPRAATWTAVASGAQKASGSLEGVVGVLVQLPSAFSSQRVEPIRIECSPPWTSIDSRSGASEMNVVVTECLGSEARICSERTLERLR